MNSNNISRRGFLGASAVVMAGVAGLTATGCSAESSLEAVDKHELPVDPAKGGEWISAACWHNCGGRCMNKVMVKDAPLFVRRPMTRTRIPSSIRSSAVACAVKPSSSSASALTVFFIRSSARLAAWRWREVQRQMRGKDEWEVISWDEAIKLASEEIKRISDEYGPTGFYCKANNATLNVLSGYVRGWIPRRMARIRLM